MMYFLGIDLGGTVVKASLFDEQGREIGSAGRRTPLIAEEPGQAERDTGGIRTLAFESIRETLSGAGVSADQVAAVAPTGHGKGLYTLKKDGSPGLGIVSTDTRSWKIGAEQMSAPDFDRFVYARTLQPYWPAHTAPILAWLKRGHPEQYREIAHVLLAKDLVRYFLTGTIMTERTDISGTGFWNNRESRIDQEILDRLDISDILPAIPPVGYSHDNAGAVTDEAAAATGLRPGTPVLAGLFDVNACALATGLERPDEMTAVVGTWGISAFVASDVSRAIEAPEHFVIQEHCVPGQFLVHEASPTSASNLEWFVETFLQDLPENERFDYCNTVVTGTPDTRVTYFPYLFGDDMGAHASGTFLGMRAGTDRKEVIRAIYEGIVFQHLRHVNKLLPVMQPPERVRFAGGATRSAVWMQLFADTLGLPVTVSPATELGALGASICAAVGIGAFPDYSSAMEAMTSVRDVYEPDPEKGEPLRRKQQQFAELVRQMAPVWKAYE